MHSATPGTGPAIVFLPLQSDMSGSKRCVFGGRKTGRHAWMSTPVQVRAMHFARDDRAVDRRSMALTALKGWAGGPGRSSMGGLVMLWSAGALGRGSPRLVGMRRPDSTKGLLTDRKAAWPGRRRCGGTITVLKRRHEPRVLDGARTALRGGNRDQVPSGTAWPG